MNEGRAEGKQPFQAQQCELRYIGACMETEYNCWECKRRRKRDFHLDPRDVIPA